MFPQLRPHLITFAIALLMLGATSVHHLHAQDEAPEVEGAEAGTVPATEEAPVDFSAEWLMDEAQTEHYRKREKIGIIKFSKQKSATKTQEELLRKNVHYYLSKLTFPDQSKLSKLVADRLIGELMSPIFSENSRVVSMDEILRVAPDLLQHPQPIVRYNTVAIISRLDIESANLQSKTPNRPYEKAHKLLLDVLNNTTQETDARIIAVRGLGRIGRDATNLGGNQRSDIAIALCDALKNIPVDTEDENWWFRYRIIESLGYVGRLDNVSREPIVLDNLMSIINNPKERVLNRSQAALSLSRLPWTGTTPGPQIVYSINKLLSDMAGNFPKIPNHPIWRSSFSRVYLSYRPGTRAEASLSQGMLYQIKRPGVAKNATIIQSGWEVAFPICKPIIATDPAGSLSAADLKNLRDWLEANKQYAPKTAP